MDLPAWVNAIGTWFIFGATAALVIVAWMQIRGLIAQQRRDAFRLLFEGLQNESVREARRQLFRAHDEGKTSSKPSNWEEALVKAAELAAAKYDEAASLYFANAIEKEPFLSNWGPSILKCWKAARPLIDYQRKIYGLPTRWLYFQRLADLVAEQPDLAAATPPVAVSADAAPAKNDT